MELIMTKTFKIAFTAAAIAAFIGTGAFAQATGDTAPSGRTAQANGGAEAQAQEGRQQPEPVFVPGTEQNLERDGTPDGHGGRRGYGGPGYGRGMRGGPAPYCPPFEFRGGPGFAGGPGGCFGRGFGPGFYGPRRGGFDAKDEVAVNGKLAALNGRIVLKDGAKTYYIIGLGQLVGFVDGLKEGASVTLKGFVREFRYAPDYGVIRADLLTINGKDYQLR
jgi:hypothetical protein